MADVLLLPLVGVPAGLALCLGVLGACHWAIEECLGYVNSRQLQRDTQEELREKPRRHPCPQFHRIQTPTELRLQQACVELSAKLGIPPPAVYVSSWNRVGVSAWFDPQDYAVHFNPKYFRGPHARRTRHVLKHELVHAWSFVRGKPLDHGSEFEDKARQFGTS